MLITRPQSDELAFCVDMYLQMNDESFIPADRKKSLHAMERVHKQMKYLRVAKSEEGIIGWMLAEPAPLDHCSLRIMQQRYFSTNQKGIKAARVVLEMHRDLVNYSKFYKFDMVTSPGSHLDEEYKFARILERDGWSRRGFMAMFDLRSVVV